MVLFRLLGDIVNHPANRQARASALMRAFRWQLSKRLTGRPLDISYHGKRLRCHPASHSASQAVYFSCLPDYWEMRFVRDYLRPGDSFIDVGANVGLYTILALSVVGDKGQIHAFEPNPLVAAMLRESIVLNSANNITVHEIGLADIEGEAAFASEGDHCVAHIVDSSGDAGTRIPIGRLDRLLPEAPYAMMKLDIEGYEPFAIRGASQWTKKQIPPVMLIEMGGYTRRYGILTNQFVDELDEIGYFTAVYDPDSRQITARKPWETTGYNVLAIAKDRQKFVEKRLLDSRA